MYSPFKRNIQQKQKNMNFVVDFVVGNQIKIQLTTVVIHVVSHSRYACVNISGRI